MMDRMDTDDHSGMVYLVAVFKETLPISNSPSLVDASEEERQTLVPREDVMQILEILRQLCKFTRITNS